MLNTQDTPVLDSILGAATATKTPWKVDVSRGSLNGTVSSQWFKRPADQRFLSLADLHRSTKLRAINSRADVMESNKVEVRAQRDNPTKLELALPSGEIAAPTHWSFGQLSALVGAPASYLRKLPAPLAAINLQHGLVSHRAEMVKTYTADDGARTLRAVTGPDYGRIHDHELVEAVMNIADQGGWKIPGVIDWSSGMYDPMAPVTSDSTTLYASDRDVFLFMVDDTHPIEVGKLKDGSPDLMFRGFYAWNSEVGSKALGIASMYLRAVCMNRNLWGVENFQEISVRHSKMAPQRFAAEAIPALQSFSNQSTSKVLAGVRDAKAAVVATNDEERVEFLRKQDFSKANTASIIDLVLKEEGSPPESIWDFVQGITAFARDIPNQDDRIEVELVGKRLLDRVA